MHFRSPLADDPPSPWRPNHCRIFQSHERREHRGRYDRDSVLGLTRHLGLVRDYGPRKDVSESKINMDKSGLMFLTLAHS